jgi:hypothetical protein
LLDSSYLPVAVKLGSSAPHGLQRARAKSLPLWPATTIRPEESIASAVATSWRAGAKLVVTLPPVPNVGSRVPSGS